MPLIPQSCPSCSSPLVVTQLNCTVCGTGVVGKFELSPGFRLSPESLHFLAEHLQSVKNQTVLKNPGGYSGLFIKQFLTLGDFNLWTITPKR